MIGAVGLEPGTLVDGWHITRALRAGGFGAVHHAEQNGKAFALKVALHREESGDTGRTHSRALREVAILLTMDHPHIIKPRGFGYLPDGRVYCVLEYVDGWTLGEWLERTHPTFREIARVFAKIAGAVAYMHARDVLHRDLKLSNVMVRRNGEPVIIDLGCATYENADELTATPLPPGTERYRAPEALAFLRTQGRKPGTRYPFKVTDELFAVGVMLYELLTEPLPAKDNPRPGFANPVSNLFSPREVNPRVPPALSALVEELLARDPAQRPESFEALRRRLAELADHPGPEYAAEAHPPSAQRPPPPGEGAGRVAAPRPRWRSPLALVGLVAAVVLVAAAAAWFMRGERPAPATAPKEGSTVKPQPPDAPQSPLTERAPKAAPAPEDPGFPAWCKTLPVAVALAHGCATAPILPQSFDCPPGAQEAMFDKLGWTTGDDFDLRLDERGPEVGLWQYTLGAPVTGVVEDDFPDQVKAPPRTLFHGRAFVDEKEEHPPHGVLRVLYDHVEIPGKGKFPVCVLSGPHHVFEMKDGIATSQNLGTAKPTRGWKPSRD
jgi:serine/threonine-protein kinase